MRAKWNFVLGHDSAKKPRRSGAKVQMGLPRRWLPTIKASLVAAVTQPDHDTYPAAAPSAVFRFPPTPA